MATHTYTYPDCPICGVEMGRKSIIQQKSKKVSWWECQNCGIASPAVSENDVQEALDWVRKEKIRRAAK